jgi:hypothetical protein
MVRSYTGVKLLPAYITIPEPESNDNNNNNFNVLNTTEDLSNFLKPSDGVFIYSSTQLRILTVNKVHSNKIITKEVPNLYFENIPMKIKKIDYRYLRYYKNMTLGDRKAIHVKFKREDRMTQDAKAIRELKFLNEKVKANQKIENENAKKEFEMLYKVDTFNNEYTQHRKKWFMEWSRINPQNSIAETAYSLGYAKMLKDGWMPVEGYPNLYRNQIYRELRCDLTSVPTWKTDDSSHEACRCTTMLCRQCRKDHSHLLTIINDFLMGAHKRKSITSSNSDKRQCRSAMMMPTPVDDENNNTDNSNNNSSASFRNGNNNRRANNGMEVDSDGGK